MELKGIERKIRVESGTYFTIDLMAGRFLRQRIIQILLGLKLVSESQGASLNHTKNRRNASPTSVTR